MAEQLRSGSVSLDREVQALFGTWKGSAADAYRAGWDDMQDGGTHSPTWRGVGEPNDSQTYEGATGTATVGGQSCGSTLAGFWLRS
ncbi:hypothetical protein IFM12276_33510 [Nocardia sputorum]|uniref:WXG100 family type VII secretion target n=1 Tax=Nocardia sputorum TaxID=2984338 RepID=A0ABM8CZ65_9NOCA|nr:hypothetical protein IFM12276_33510 [Nocardia sputorum]